MKGRDEGESCNIGRGEFVIFSQKEGTMEGTIRGRRGERKARWKARTRPTCLLNRTITYNITSNEETPLFLNKIGYLY